MSFRPRRDVESKPGARSPILGSMKWAVHVRRAAITIRNRIHFNSGVFPHLRRGCGIDGREWRGAFPQLEVLCSNAFHFEHRPEHGKVEIPSLNQAQGTGLVAMGATWRAARKADVNVRTAHVPCDAMWRHVAMRHGATQDQNADCRQQHMALQLLVPTF